jgi:hypothetical protein
VQPNPGVLGIPLGSTRVTDLAVGQTPWYELSATDGIPPYAWSVAPGHSLPPGVQLVSGNGLGALGFYPGASALMGIATQAGDFTFDLVVTDQAGSQARRTFEFHVAPFTVLGNTNNTVIAGSPFTMRFVPVGVTPPSTFTLSPTGALQDVLPPGVSLSADGLLSGTPTSTGVYNSWMKVTDGANRTYTQYLRLIVNAAGASTPFRVTGQNPGSTWVGGYGYRSLATNRSGAALTWSAVGALPAGVRLVRSTSQTTYVSGTGVAPGSYTFTLRARDDGTGDMADHTFTWKVGNVQVVFPAWPITNVLDIPAAEQGQPYSFAFGLAGGTRPYTVTPSSFDPLPPGLALSTEGVLSGTPERSGSYTISLVVTDAGGIVTEIGGLTLIVTPPSTPPPLIRTGSIFLSASVGAPYAFALDGTLRGGTPPFTWELEPGSSLPPGLVLFPGGNGVSAHIGGTASVPNSPGSPYGFWLTVTDSGGQALTTYLTLNVSPLAITPDALPPGRVGTSYSQALLVSGGVGPYTISLNTVSDMPPGLSLSPTGLLSGTPSSPGIYGISLRVTDSVSNVLTKVLYVFVDNAAGDVPTVTMSPRRVQVYHEVGAPLPVAQPVTVGASSSAGVVSLALHAAPGVTLTSTGGTAPFTTHVGFDISTLPAGTYAGLLAVSGRGMANLGDAIPVSVVVAPAPPCTYRVEPVGGSVPNLGGSGTFEVKTGWTCGWTAVSSAPWLTVTAGATGTASGSVTYLAAVNPDPGVRTATITVAGAVYTVSQLGTECSFTIDPAETSATAWGGQATVNINASSTACAWSSSVGPLTIVPANGTGSGTVTVTVPANGAPESRTLTATIAGRTFSVLQTGIDCTVALGAGGTTVPSGASAGSVEVTTPAGCPYSTVPGPNWISITSGGSGTGSGTLVYNVEANSTTYPRSGTLIVGGQPFQITQDPLPCSVTLNTTLLGSPYGTAAATGSIGVTANGANCSWTASSNAPWATVSPDSGTGNRTLTMSVQSNEAGTSSRAGEVLIAGQTVAISQAGTVCSYVLESTSGVASAIGGTASVRVIAPTPCSWSATSNASWLTITASGSSGTSAVQFTVAANPAASARSGTLTIRGLTYTVEQAGASCSFAIVGPSTSPLLASAGATGQSFAFAASATGCSPSAVSYANWITIDGTSFIGTAGTVTYSVASNPYGVERRGTIQVGNALYTIVQAGAPCGYSLSIYGRLFHVEGGIDTLLASPTAAACTPTAGTDMPSFITLGPLTGPVLNLFSLPYEVAPFPSLTPTVRVGRITLGGQILTIKQLSW